MTTTTKQTSGEPLFGTTRQHTLRKCVEIALENYFAQLEGEVPSNLYELVLAEVEAPLLESVLAYTQGNQTKAAKILGLNRGTLRKKLRHYGIFQ
ncbi:MAG: DNA-binding transcriptional regulator Fis [Gammaproteobacteria bacterium]|nr:MAG: DNA-binding transcriptional regulator Fis [Gammaproteobacteria bacterium]